MSNAEAFEEYLTKYCMRDGISKEEAKKHLIVRIQKEYYDEVENERRGKKEICTE